MFALHQKTSGDKQLDHDHPELEYAECISITFEQQKKDKKMDTVLLMTSEDILLCPVRAAATIVKRIRNYSGTTQKLPNLHHSQRWHH